MENTLYTVKQTAEVMQCSQGYVRKLNKAGLLIFIKLGSLKVRKSTLEKFLQKWDGWDLTDPYKPRKLGGNAVDKEDC